jgi:hypothetical protein
MEIKTGKRQNIFTSLTWRCWMTSSYRLRVRSNWLAETSDSWISLGQTWFKLRLWCIVWCWQVFENHTSHTKVPPSQYHHMSIYTSCSPLLVVAEVSPTSEIGAPIGHSFVAPVMWVMICMTGVPGGALTLLWYHEKSYVNSTMGSYWPHLKNQNKSSLLQCFFFSPNNILKHVCTQILTNRHNFA